MCVIVNIKACACLLIINSRTMKKTESIKNIYEKDDAVLEEDGVFHVMILGDREKSKGERFGYRAWVAFRDGEIYSKGNAVSRGIVGID